MSDATSSQSRTHLKLGVYSLENHTIKVDIIMNHSILNFATLRLQQKYSVNISKKSIYFWSATY